MRQAEGAQVDSDIVARSSSHSGPPLPMASGEKAKEEMSGRDDRSGVISAAAAILRLWRTIAAALAAASAAERRTPTGEKMLPEGAHQRSHVKF